ncbi:hypothetical protein GF412_02785 [Candidatus Micrarchaeota archaeon]|nr:hypothetical protein [Candidatus Micrarchaeota archaeon]MBD3417884.1 hypothetical protein [Candidatus Micrarchaeota archaeon]
MSEVDNLTEKTVEEGGVLALLYFDIHGTDRDTLVNLSTGLVQKVLKQDGVVFARGEIDEPMEAEGMFSTSLELKVLTKDVVSLAQLCADFSPFSLELLEPQEFRVPVPHMQDLFMFVSTNSHDYKKYILQKLSPPEKGAEYAKNLHARAELGKKLLEKKKK